MLTFVSIILHHVGRQNVQNPTLHAFRDRSYIATKIRDSCTLLYFKKQCQVKRENDSREREEKRRIEIYTGNETTFKELDDSFVISFRFFHFKILPPRFQLRVIQRFNVEIGSLLNLVQTHPISSKHHLVGHTLICMR